MTHFDNKKFCPFQMVHQTNRGIQCKNGCVFLQRIRSENRINRVMPLRPSTPAAMLLMKNQDVFFEEVDESSGELCFGGKGMYELRK